MFMLIFPKFWALSSILKIINLSKLAEFWGFKAIAEIVFSAFVAPIMMMFQSKFVWDIFTGQMPAGIRKTETVALLGKMLLEDISAIP